MGAARNVVDCAFDVVWEPYSFATCGGYRGDVSGGNPIELDDARGEKGWWLCD